VSDNATVVAKFIFHHQGRNGVRTPPPDQIEKNQAHPALPIKGNRGHCVGTGGGWRQVVQRAHLIVTFCLDIPLIFCHIGNLSIPCPPNEIVQYRAKVVCALMLLRGLSHWNGCRRAMGGGKDRGLKHMRQNLPN
jgi:hypothetical protein